MNSFWTQIVTQTILRKKNKGFKNKKDYSRLEIARGFRELKIIVVRNIKDFILITLGIFSAAAAKVP